MVRIPNNTTNNRATLQGLGSNAKSYTLTPKPEQVRWKSACRRQRLLASIEEFLRPLT